ncbi:aminodeoxychorismate/anthranilate synthase component II [Candidatus Wirthbacteria bacterium CG2_30_54_11]|uniref:Aminodeoxychorismate/anthranilate synthase component II n=1 Tax=Candidatus Wirthbacteria bacterium CG2_30_54_11 TaxID=1817892 RepID=A0A1J5ITD1_9BACT|nr:MAG: aminodeoxychorismate/anthranilate synthase component II [Candidatus Wirthbacteria bacterium CG2_30_54_11]
MKTLIIDNYDSFTFNLYQHFGELGASPVVYRNDKIDLQGIRNLAPTHIVISPGPGDPRDQAYFGVCAEVIRELGPIIPVLGVCLGHQGIGHIFGGTVKRAPQIMHGKTSQIDHDGQFLFAGIDSPLVAMRYHSLIVDQNGLPDDLIVTATTRDDQIIMGLRHRIHPIFGIQFHPESIGTPSGKQMLNNFMRITHV